MNFCITLRVKAIINIILQENLLEKPNVLIYDDEMFEFDDTNEINEDTIIVTGFTVRFDY